VKGTGGWGGDDQKKGRGGHAFMNLITQSLVFIPFRDITNVKRGGLRKRGRKKQNSSCGYWGVLPIVESHERGKARRKKGGRW